MKKKRFFDEHIGDALKRYLSTDNRRLSDKYLESKLKEILKTKLGDLLGSYTTDVMYKNGRLYLTLNSAPLKSELMQGRQKLINMLNTELKGEYVKDIILK